jgi:hypothetical protein
MHPSTRLSDLRQLFDNSPREFSPTPIWWWSGDRLDLDRLRWQLEQLAAGGVFNVVILNLAPAGPLYGKDADDPPFMSEDWWSIFSAVCVRAETLGVRIWFYDQIGFSGANIQGQLCVRDQRCRGRVLACDVIEGTHASHAAFPPVAEPLAAFVTDLDDEGKPTGAPRELPIDDRSVRCETAGRHRLRLAYALQGGFDYFDPGSCALLLDTVHGEFERRVEKYFGNVIAGSFQDELPSMPSWSREFSCLFRERAGYDLTPLLWAAGKLAPRVSARYRQAIRRLPAHAPLVRRAGKRPPRRDTDSQFAGRALRTASRLGRVVSLQRLGRHP